MHSLAIHQMTALRGQESHRAPTERFSIDQAHQMMQFHVACRANRCYLRKVAALHALTESGRAVPYATKPAAILTASMDAATGAASW
ncbi:hypothetical protein [Nocardia exalbida]|uniref:hypothetical protein n=1 Tax=Nocardia exalbida TaxID=290231 RepID=UPI000593EE95|nr:hypothetical protein [Nocardia exalbida]